MDVEPKAQIASRKGYVWLHPPGFRRIPSFSLPMLRHPSRGARFLAMSVVIAHDTVRVTRWRREYEVSFVRVIRTSRKNRK